MVDMNRVYSNPFKGGEAVRIMKEGDYITDTKRVYGIVKIPNPDGYHVEYVVQYLDYDDIAEVITPLNEWESDYRDNEYRAYRVSLDADQAVEYMKNGCMVMSLDSKEIYFIGKLKIPCIGDKEYVFILDFDDLPCAYETPEDFIKNNRDVFYKTYTRS